jgi:hypothetical protein
MTSRISMKSLFMQLIFLLVVALACSLGISTPALGQQVHPYTVKSNQPAKLVADAGPDVVAKVGEERTLGGDPIATGGTPPYSVIWSPADGLSDPEDTHPQIMVEEEGATYVLTVTDDKGCTASDEIIITAEVITAVISDHDKEFQVFPNPSKSWLVVRLSGVEGGNMTVVDSRGTSVMTGMLNVGENRFDVSSFRSGQYFLRLSNGRTTQTIRIVVP